MPPAYTQALWTKYYGVGGGPWFAPAIPSGYCWILRDVSLINRAGHSAGVGVAQIEFTVNSIVVLETDPYWSISEKLYRWSDIRIRISGEDSFSANSSDQYWGWYITGYQLSV